MAQLESRYVSPTLYCYCRRGQIYRVRMWMHVEMNTCWYPNEKRCSMVDCPGAADRGILLSFKFEITSFWVIAGTSCRLWSFISSIAGGKFKPSNLICSLTASETEIHPSLFFSCLSYFGMPGMLRVCFRRIKTLGAALIQQVCSTITLVWLERQDYIFNKEDTFSLYCLEVTFKNPSLGMYVAFWLLHMGKHSELSTTTHRFLYTYKTKLLPDIIYSFRGEDGNDSTNVSSVSDYC